MILIIPKFQDFDKAKAFLFLAEIKRLFIAEYGLTVATSIAYGMNTEFSPVLALEMRRFSESDDMSTINAMHGQMGELKNIMVMNIDTMTQRGEKIDLLVNKAENLRNSVKFLKNFHVIFVFIHLSECNLEFQLTRAVCRLMCGVVYQCGVCECVGSHISVGN